MEPSLPPLFPSPLSLLPQRVQHSYPTLLLPLSLYQETPPHMLKARIQKSVLKILVQLQEKLPTVWEIQYLLRWEQPQFSLMPHKQFSLMPHQQFSLMPHQHIQIVCKHKSWQGSLVVCKNSSLQKNFLMVYKNSSLQHKFLVVCKNSSSENKKSLVLQKNKLQRSLY